MFPATSSFAVLALVCGQAQACTDLALVLKMPHVLTNSRVVEIPVIVAGLPAELWSPVGVYRLKWNPNELRLLGMAKYAHPALERILLGVRGAAESGDVSVHLLCDVGCDAQFVPAQSQPLTVATFEIVSPFEQASLSFECDLGVAGALTTLFEGKQGDPVHPGLVDGSVRLVAFVRGDSNGDRRVDISDPLAILTQLFVEAETRCEDPADANDDGQVDVSDAVYLLSYLFLGDEAPPPPFPESGYDDTADALRCPDAR